jgi:hypothetical protein
MSILILGKSICPLCKKAINSGDEFYSFPAFVHNIKDPIYIINDTTCHVDCLEKEAIGKKAVALAELFNNSIKPANRRSVINGNIITEFKDHIFIDYLTSDINSFLYRFNFAHIDKKNLLGWKEKEHLIEELKKLSDTNEWQEANNYNYLGKLIMDLSGS